MLKPTNTDRFSPLVPKAHNSECQILSPLHIKPVSQLMLIVGFLFFAPSALTG